MSTLVTATLPAHRFCTAPMIDWTDRHCRYFFRLFSKNMQIYTEMVTTGALLYGDTEHFLAFNAAEHPLVLQLGGSDINDLAQCTQLAAEYGYNEVNLNLGCPSPRVQKGRFGACLMAEPQHVSECLQAMQAASDLPISLKCRLGIDSLDSEAFLMDFLGNIDEAGCHHWIIHARIALLNGLSPKENRTIPPLIYERVHQAKRNFPQSTIIINGGFTDLSLAYEQLEHVDGVMLGRAAYQNPKILAAVDSLFYQDLPDHTTQNWQPQALNIAYQFGEYLESLTKQDKSNQEIKRAIRHTLGLMNGLKGAKQWRRYLSESLGATENPLGLWYKSLKPFESTL